MLLMHMPFVHSKLLVHVVPVPPVATHAGVALHQKPVAQPTLVSVGGVVPVTLHVVTQAVPPVLHAKLFPQAPAVPAVQVPVPLHEPAGVNELPVQDAVPQDVVAAVSWQTPPAAQLPVKPHGGAAVH
jgi:hypothetical protein